MIRISQFSGEIPRAIPRNLPPASAQYAVDCDFSRGDLRGMLTKALALTAPSAVKAFFRYDSNWYTWATDVDVVRGPIAEDAYYRFYWADGTNFWVSNGHSPSVNTGAPPAVGNKFHVGVPTPASAPSLAGEYGDYPVGVTGYIFTGACRSADGTETTKAVTVTVNTAGRDYTIGLGSACAEGNTFVITLNVTQDTGTIFGCKLSEDSSTGQLPTGVGNGVWQATLTKASDTEYDVILDTDGDTETRAYVFTIVNTYGEEGSPSEPLLVDVVPGMGQVIECAIPAQGSYVSFGKARLYRTATGTNDTTYLFVGEYTCTPGSALTIYDTVETSQLGEQLSALGYSPPPQTLRSIVVLPNGIMAGLKGNEVWFSEPYMPYAWKPGNAITMQDAGVGACVYEQSLFVTTTGRPRLFSGVSPDAITETIIPSPQAGVSKRSVGQVGPYVAFLSNDGVVIVRGTDATPTDSLRLFTREVWRERFASALASSRITSHDGKAYITFDNGASGFVLNLEDQSGCVWLDETVDAAFIHPEADALYISQGANIYNLHVGPSRKSYTWQSKDFVTPAPMNFGALQLIGSGSLTYSLYADGGVVSTATVSLSSAGTIVRLPSGFKAKIWSITLEGTGIVQEANLAVMPAEFADA